MEQRLPSLLQETEQIRLAYKHLVEASIQIILGDQVRFLTQQIAHRTAFIPFPMQPPLTARIDQPVDHKRLQHIQPACSLPGGRQPRRPEIIQSQLVPHMARQPTRTPLPRPAQPQATEPDMHHIAIERRSRTILGK